MTQMVIRAIRGEELLDITSQLNAYAFYPSPPLYTRENWERLLFLLDEALHFALFEDGKAVATVACNPLTQQIRGQIYSGGGIWGVTTHPAARRKGYVKQLLQHLFAAMRDEGMAVSCLYPFRESFYDRLGYTTFPRARKVRFSPLALLPLLKKDLAGAVELVLIKDGYEAYRAYLHQRQQQIHGMALFGDKAATVMFEQNNYWLAIARIEGEAVGMMLYQLKGELDDMVVPRFYYDDSQGLYLLLEWFARHADQAKEVEVKLPAYELPETWLADLNLNISSFEPPMGRVLNLMQLNGMASGPGRFSAQISDPVCPWNEGRYLFETLDGKLQISPSTIVTTDCELTIQALSALIYGTHDPASFAIRGWGNPAPPLQTTLRTMFPPKLPYLHEVF